MKRIILLFGLIFSLVAVKAHAGGTPTNEQKAYNQSIGLQKIVILTEDQRVKVEVVLLSKIIAIEAINNDAAKDQAAKNAAIENVRKDKNQELAAIMTPDQYNLYLIKMEELRNKKAAEGH